MVIGKKYKTKSVFDDVYKDKDYGSKYRKPFLKKHGETLKRVCVATLLACGVVTIINGVYDSVMYFDAKSRGLLDFNEKTTYVEGEGFIPKKKEGSPVKVRISDDNSVTSIMVRNVLNSYEIYVSSVQNNITALSDGMKKLNMKKTDRLFINTSMSIELITTVLGKEAFFDYEYVDAYATVDMRNSILYAVACMIISFGALFAGVDLLKEKSYGVINRYKAGGGSVIRLVANKLVFYTVVIYSLILIPNVIGSLVKKSSIDITMMLLYLLIVVFSLSSSMLIATVTGKIRTYVLVGNMLTICTYLVGGGIIPATYLPENMLKLSKFTPAYSFIQMLIKVSCDMPVSMFKTVIITYTFITIGCAVLSGYILKRKEA